jgi:hypothetical protein
MLVPQTGTYVTFFKLPCLLLTHTFGIHNTQICRKQMIQRECPQTFELYCYCKYCSIHKLATYQILLFSAKEIVNIYCFDGFFSWLMICIFELVNILLYTNVLDICNVIIQNM